MIIWNVATARLLARLLDDLDGVGGEPEAVPEDLLAFPDGAAALAG
jgi:hypothetical protein